MTLSPAFQPQCIHTYYQLPMATTFSRLSPDLPPALFRLVCSPRHAACRLPADPSGQHHGHQRLHAGVPAAGARLRRRRPASAALRVRGALRAGSQSSGRRPARTQRSVVSTVSRERDSGVSRPEETPWRGRPSLRGRLELRG